MTGRMVGDGFRTQAHECASPPVVVRESDCEMVVGKADVRRAREERERVLSARHGRPVDGYDEALARLDDEHTEPMIRAADPLPDDPGGATTAHYHATPELNTPDILEYGLDVTMAENAPTGDGVYVAPTRTDAEMWANVICKEEGWRCFDILRVDVPECLPVLPDERIRDDARHLYPDSNVVATSYGLPPRFIEVEREEYVADGERAP